MSLRHYSGLKFAMVVHRGMGCTDEGKGMREEGKRGEEIDTESETRPLLLVPDPALVLSD